MQDSNYIYSNFEYKCDKKPILNHSQYKALFTNHYQVLCNYAYTFLQDIDLAEDVVQDVFVKLWNIKEEIDPKVNLRSYVFTMTKNRALEVLRRQNIGSKIIKLISTQNEETMEMISDEEIEKQIKIDQLYMSIRHLPPKCGEIFILAKVNGISYTHIAEQLNISPKTVEHQVAKAMKLLKNMLR